MKLSFVCLVLCLLSVARAYAEPVGEMHRVASEQAASARDAKHRDQLRMTIWYPAAADAVERPLVLGPPERPLRTVGSVALDAAFAADGARRPVILLSHGFGGSARIMGWFGIAMAREGYIVVAVDHPGNNAIDEMTVPGAILYWDRADDLRVALEAAERDPAIGPHMDLARVGVAGFSAGGFTALVAGGARVEPSHLARFCAANPDDGVCRPQLELAVKPEEFAKTLEQPDVAAEVARAGDDHSIPAVRAVFAMAPALVQALDPAGLADLRRPVHIVLGDADTVAPPTTNGLAAAGKIPGAELEQLPGVGHYDFLSPCTEEGQKIIPLCKTRVPQVDTHRRAIAAAQDFFGRNLKNAP
jgi:predicted dienelactone hydrolase